ncbi:TPA: hypothetical protein ACH902_004779, partial [Escherichia coli]
STSKTPSYTKSVSWQHHPPIASLRASKYDVAAVELKENKTADAMRVRVICFFIIISVSCIEVFWV